VRTAAATTRARQWCPRRTCSVGRARNPADVRWRRSSPRGLNCEHGRRAGRGGASAKSCLAIARARLTRRDQMTPLRTNSVETTSASLAAGKSVRVRAGQRSGKVYIPRERHHALRTGPRGTRFFDDARWDAAARPRCFVARGTNEGRRRGSGDRCRPMSTGSNFHRPTSRGRGASCRVRPDAEGVTGPPEAVVGDRALGDRQASRRARREPSSSDSLPRERGSHLDERAARWLGVAERRAA